MAPWRKAVAALPSTHRSSDRTPRHAHQLGGRESPLLAAGDRRVDPRWTWFHAPVLMPRSSFVRPLLAIRLFNRMLARGGVISKPPLGVLLGCRCSVWLCL